jgi:hypothetical protein
MVCAPEDMHLLNGICEKHHICCLHRLGYAAESHEKFLEVKPFSLRGEGRAFREL